MPSVKDIYEFINSFAPFSAQCSWDNSGIAVGNPEQNVSKITVALDITPDVIESAVKNGSQLIISHHPVIFKARKNVMSNDPVYMLVSNGISAICAHTSLDTAEGGVNNALARKLCLENVERLTGEGEASMVRVGTPDKEYSAEEFARFTAEKLGGAVRYSDCGKPVKKVALCGGSGCDFLRDAADAGCDLFVSGDASHRNFLDGLEIGISVIAAGHYETENPVVYVLAEKLEKEFPVEVHIAETSSPCRTIINKE